MEYIEILGICASVLLIISVTVKSVSVKGNILMRAINIVGSTGFVIYGLVIGAYSTAIANGCMIVIHIYYVIEMIKELRCRD